MNSNLTFITGNQDKADYLAKYLGISVKLKKIDLEEIQSLDLKKIVRQKVLEAYKIVKSPVFVEDVSLEFKALNGLPGPFIKFFVDHVDFQTICDMLNGKGRSAIARCVFGYYDGKDLELFEGSMNGRIAKTPSGKGGYGFDRFFIPEGYNVTRASLNEKDDKKTYLTIKPFKKFKKFILKI